MRTDYSPVVVELQMFKVHLRFIIFPMSTWMSRSSILFHFKAFAVAGLFSDSIQYYIETITDKYVCTRKISRGEGLYAYLNFVVFKQSKKAISSFIFSGRFFQFN